MKQCVIDANVVVQLFFEEQHSEAAEHCLRQGGNLLAPDLVWVEVASVIWKRQRRGDISQEDALGIARQTLSLPLRIYSSFDLMADALALAIRFERSVYDSLYLALAVRSKSCMITADKRLANALANTPVAKHVLWIGDVQ